MVTTETLNDRLTRLEEQFNSFVKAEAGRHAAEWRVILGLSGLLTGLAVWAISKGFDPGSIVHAVG